MNAVVHRPEERPDADDILVQCTCGHIEDFHAKGNPALGEDRCCLALNCGCGNWEPAT